MTRLLALAFALVMIVPNLPRIAPNLTDLIERIAG
jgi:hypothetical protein